MDIFDALTLVGGLALFLLGMNLMGDALEKKAGGRLKTILENLTSNPAKGFLLGLAVTAVIQSSSATTVMVVGFVSAGVMTLHQAIYIIMGANVGTTVTAWLLSLAGIDGSSFFITLLKPSSFTPVLALIGIVLYLFCKAPKKKDTGMILLGFAVLMTGMSEMSGDIMRTVDKLDKIGPNKVRQLLMDELHMFSHKADDVMDFMAISGTNAEVIAGLERYKGMDELFDEGLEELKTVTRYLADFGVPEENFAIDLSIARGLDYYTGTVYETEMTAHPEIGSICSGGRYDDLAGYYTDKKLPGVGISIGLTRLFYVLNEQGMLSDETVSAPADALVIPMAEDLGYAIAAATALRDAGVRTQLYCEQKKFKAKMSYADKLGIPYVILIGEDEIAENVVAVKNMTTGEQTKLGFADAASLIKKDMDDRARAAVIKE